MIISHALLFVSLGVGDRLRIVIVAFFLVAFACQYFNLS